MEFCQVKPDLGDWTAHFGRVDRFSRLSYCLEEAGADGEKPPEGGTTSANDTVQLSGWAILRSWEFTDDPGRQKARWCRRAMSDRR